MIIIIIIITIIMTIKTELSLFFKKLKYSIYTFQKQKRTFRIIRQCARSISVSHFFSLSLWLKTHSYSGIPRGKNVSKHSELR